MRIHPSAILVPIALSLVMACAARDLPPTEPASARLAAADHTWDVIPFGIASMGEARVAVLEYAPGLEADLYFPPGDGGERRIPLVIFVLGLSRDHFLQNIGVGARETGLYTSLCAATASMGAAAAIADIQDPVQDFEAFLAYLAREGPRLGLDMRRVFLWARSEHGSFALRVADATHPFSGRIRGVCLFTPILSPVSAKAAPGIPVLLVKAGLDERIVNEYMDSYAKALGRKGNEVTLVEFPAGRHAFEIHQLEDAEAVRMVALGLEFALRCLRP